MCACPSLIEDADTAIAALGPFRSNCFGHLGDGNLHFNVFPPKGGQLADFKAARAEVTRVVHDIVDGLGGSISAEHGIGRAKVEDLARYSDPAKLSAMAAIKHALDPKGIMNPGVIFPA